MDAPGRAGRPDALAGALTRGGLLLPRVGITPGAAAVVARLVFEADVLLGRVAGAPFSMSASQHESWRHTHLTVDVVPGRGAGSSLEAPDGVRFLIRSRLLSDEGSALAEPASQG